jgi:hypothetical protein
LFFLSWEFYFIHDNDQHTKLRPCVIDSLFRGPWPPEIGARVLITQHKIDFQNSAFLLQIYTKNLCWEFSKSWKMDELCIFHCHVDNLRHQNGCVLWIWNPGWIEASRIRGLDQGHLETVWVLAGFEILGGEKQVGLEVLIRDTWKQFGFWLD